MYDGRMCQHCNSMRANRPRGLCWTCYYAPGRRDLYPSTSKYGRRGVCEEDFHGGLQSPPLPTDAVPGTEDKIRVLEQRAAMLCSLWHEDDATLRAMAFDAVREDTR